MTPQHKQISEQNRVPSRAAIVFLSYHDLREIEWILPTILKYYDSYKIFIPFKESSIRHEMIASLLNSTNGSLHTYTDLVFQSKLGSWISQLLPSSLHAMICSLIKVSHQRLIPRLIQNAITRNIINAIRLEAETAFYFSLASCDSEPRFISSILNDFEIKSVPFSAFSINFIRNIPTNILINNIDYTCTAPLEEFGRMQPELIKPILDFYERTNHWKQIKENAKQRKIAVLFTKNMSAFNNLYDPKFRIEYREKILSRLHSTGFYTVIKPHPGERVKHGLQSDHFIISELPSVFLSKVANVTVFELPTNSIFDALTNNKTPYLPFDLMSEVLGKSKEQIINQFPIFFKKLVEEDCVCNCPNISAHNCTQNRIEKYILRKV